MRRMILGALLRALRSQWWSQERIARYSDAALIAMLRHAVTHVPYYRDLGIAAADIRSPADLLQFPLLTKRIVQEQGARLLADGFATENLHSSRTSGSTGEPTITWFDDYSWALSKYALKMRRIAAVAPPLFRRCLIVSEQPIEEARLYATQRPFGAGILYRERVISLFEEMPAHIRAIDEFRPDMLYAFPSYFTELLRACTAAGRDVPRIRWLFSSSEVLTPSVRAQVEAAFQGRIHDLYGNTEFKEVAWQCGAGRYHINIESVRVDIEAPVKSATDSAPGAGNIVLTTLCNRAMPLIRFSTGDLAQPRTEACPCGRQSPGLQALHGREGDVLELPGGRRLSVYQLTTEIETLPGLRQYRIHRLAETLLRVAYVADSSIPVAELNACRARLQGLLGAGISVDFSQREQLPRSHGWKRSILVTGE